MKTFDISHTVFPMNEGVDNIADLLNRATISAGEYVVTEHHCPEAVPTYTPVGVVVSESRPSRRDELAEKILLKLIDHWSRQNSQLAGQEMALDAYYLADALIAAGKEKP